MGALVPAAIAGAARKLDPRTMVHNPVMFVTQVGSAVSTCYLVAAIVVRSGEVGFLAGMSGVSVSGTEGGLGLATPPMFPLLYLCTVPSAFDSVPGAPPGRGSARPFAGPGGPPSGRTKHRPG